MMSLKNHRQIYLLLVIGLFLPCFSVCGLGHDQKDRPLLIDTDMGLDDVRALYALLNCDSLDIQGLITVEGSASIGKATDNLIGLLETSDIFNIHLYKGKTGEGLTIPSWRKTANRLSGLEFPPPRKIRSVDRPFPEIKVLISSHDRHLHYLALGPLGNLAHLEDQFPGILEQLHTIWIPVRLAPDKTISDWNLLWDRASTETVFRTARKIVVIDLDSMDLPDAHRLFSSIQGSTPACTWIQDMLEKAGGAAPHLMIYDELAAAALIEPKLVAVQDTAWTMADAGDTGLRIEEDEAGNIHIAVFTDKEKTWNLLKECWCKKTDHTRSKTHIHTFDTNNKETALPDRALMKAFHGHLGPYVVLGYRMGKAALKTLGVQGHFDISAEVYTILTPPSSCLIDGIQLGSGCTLGKRNIKVKSHSGPAYALFQSSNGNTLRIGLKDDIPARITAWVEEKGVEPAGELMMDMEIESLLEIESMRAVQQQKTR